LHSIPGENKFNHAMSVLAAPGLREARRNTIEKGRKFSVRVFLLFLKI
jgi:hypothetical protein